MSVHRPIRRMFLRHGWCQGIGRARGALTAKDAKSARIIFQAGQPCSSRPSVVSAARCSRPAHARAANRQVNRPDIHPRTADGDRKPVLIIRRKVWVVRSRGDDEAGRVIAYLVHPVLDRLRPRKAAPHPRAYPNGKPTGAGEMQNKPQRYQVPLSCDSALKRAIDWREKWINSRPVDRAPSAIVIGKTAAAAIETAVRWELDGEGGCSAHIELFAGVAIDYGSVRHRRGVEEQASICTEGGLMRRPGTERRSRNEQHH